MSTDFHGGKCRSAGGGRCRDTLFEIPFSTSVEVSKDQAKIKTDTFERCHSIIFSQLEKIQNSSNCSKTSTWLAKQLGKTKNKHHLFSSNKESQEILVEVFADESFAKHFGKPFLELTDTEKNKIHRSLLSSCLHDIRKTHSLFFLSSFFKDAILSKKGEKHFDLVQAKHDSNAIAAKEKARIAKAKARKKRIVQEKIAQIKSKGKQLDPRQRRYLQQIRKTRAKYIFSHENTDYYFDFKNYKGREKWVAIHKIAENDSILPVEADIEKKLILTKKIIAKAFKNNDYHYLKTSLNEKTDETLSPKMETYFRDTLYPEFKFINENKLYSNRKDHPEVNLTISHYVYPQRLKSINTGSTVVSPALTTYFYNWGKEGSNAKFRIWSPYGGNTAIAKKEGRKLAVMLKNQEIDRRNAISQAKIDKHFNEIIASEQKKRKQAITNGFVYKSPLFWREVLEIKMRYKDIFNGQFDKVEKKSHYQLSYIAFIDIYSNQCRKYLPSKVSTYHMSQTVGWFTAFADEIFMDYRHLDTYKRYQNLSRYTYTTGGGWGKLTTHSDTTATPKKLAANNYYAAAKHMINDLGCSSVAMTQFSENLLLIGKKGKSLQASRKGFNNVLQESDKVEDKKIRNTLRGLPGIRLLDSVH